VTDDGDSLRREQHIVAELGFHLERVNGEIHGSATVVPEMYVPGTRAVRASIFASWTDVSTGYLAVNTFAPRVPTTLELDVHLLSEDAEPEDIFAVARLLKAGRSVVVAMVDFTDQLGRPVAFGTASFMAVPDPSVMMPREHLAPSATERPVGRLSRPFAERARCERLAPGVALLPRSDDGLNSANTVNGGLIALAIEEAVLSATPQTTLSSMALRYLRPVRLGPAIATAKVRNGLGQVEVRDAGSDDRLAVYAVTRTWRTESVDSPAEHRDAAA
jgi:acyl-coenzyme A thioesterase PaaI-like protein